MSAKSASSRRAALVFLLTATCVVWSADAVAAAPGISPADSQVILRQFDRIRRASSLTIFQVDGYHPRCYPWTFPADRVIDCHPIIQQVEAPSPDWRDSLVDLLTAPDVLVPPQASLCICNDDVVLRFAAASETTAIWLCTACGTIGMPTPVSIIGFNLTIPPQTLRGMLYGVFPKIARESRNELFYYDTPPVLSAVPMLPRQLEVQSGGVADTVRFSARVGKDGRVWELLPKRPVQGLDSLAAEYVRNYRYRPALNGGKITTGWTAISLQIPKVR